MEKEHVVEKPALMARAAKQDAAVLVEREHRRTCARGWQQIFEHQIAIDLLVLPYVVWRVRCRRHGVRIQCLVDLKAGKEGSRIVFAISHEMNETLAMQ